MAIRTAFGLGLYGVTDDTGDVWRGVPLVIEETTGRQRRLELAGRALPNVPLELPLERRGTRTLYPGQTASTDQILGYDEGTTTISGSWDTMYLRGADLALYSEGSVPGAAAAARRIETAEDLREVVYAIVRAGQRLRVTWAGVERFSSLVQFRPAHITRGRVTWEITFEWSGGGKFVTLPVTDAVESGTQSLLDTMGELLDLAAYPANLALDLIDFANATLGRIEALIADVRRVLELYTTAAADLLTVGARAVGLLDVVRRQARNLRDAVLAVGGAAGMSPVGLAGPDAAVILSAIRDWLTRTKRVSTDTAARAAALQAVFEALTQPRIKRIVTVVGDTDLRYVAQQEYGTPEAWPEIADANGLVGSSVSAGTALVIPARAA